MEKYYPCIRKALLSAIAFWGYFCTLYFIAAFVRVCFQSAETDIFGYPYICLIISDAVGMLISLFIFYDYYLCDYLKEAEFVERISESGRFSYKEEFKYLIKDPEFLTGQAVIAFFAIVVPNVYAIPVIVCSLLAELWAHKNWFKARGAFGKKKKKKGAYAFRLLLHIGIWIFNFFGLTLIVGIMKMSFTPIVTVIKNYIAIIISALAVLAISVYILRRLRAIKVQYKTIRRLKNLAKENRMKLKLPKHPYISLLRQIPEPFSLEHRHFSVNGVIIPTVLRKTPLSFLGNGLVQRTHTYYFFKIELFSRNRFMTYAFPESKRNEKKIILLSPIPREFFLADANYGTEYRELMIDNPHGMKNGRVPHTYLSVVNSEHADGDNGSEIDGALIYSGTAFCNYIRRMCDGGQ